MGSHSTPQVSADVHLPGGEVVSKILDRHRLFCPVDFPVRSFAKDFLQFVRLLPEVESVADSTRGQGSVNVLNTFNIGYELFFQVYTPWVVNNLTKYEKKISILQLW